MAGRVTYLAQIRREDIPTWNPEGANVLSGIELLTEGKYNGYPFSADEVRGAVRGNQVLLDEAQYEVPWVMGHEDETQEQTGTRRTMGYYRGFRDAVVGPGRAAINADLHVLNQWDWDAIRRGELRYNSVEFTFNTPHPKTGVELGPTISAVAAVDVPAVRSTGLWLSEGAAPVNLGEYPELMAQLGRERADHMSAWEKAKLRVQGLLGLGQDATDEQTAEAVEARLREGGPETAHGQDARATDGAHGQDARATGAGDARLKAAEEEVARLKARDAERDTQLAAERKAAHGARVRGELAKLSEKGILPPATVERLGNALAELEPTAVIKLGEGEKAHDVAVAEEVCAALGELDAIVLRQGRAHTVAAGEASANKQAAEGLAKAADGK